MKTLFLIDGAYQEAKDALYSILTDHQSVPNNWKIFDKCSTKIAVGMPQKNDLKGIDSGYANFLIKTYNDETDRKKRVKLKCFCYRYPRITGEKDFIYCVDTEEIDKTINDESIEYGFLIVRDQDCINDIVYKYEQNGRLNVVPVFLYTDFTYISAKNDQTIYKKWCTLWEAYVQNHRKGVQSESSDIIAKLNMGVVNYENVLIFSARGDKDRDIEDAKKDLVEQLFALTDRVKQKNRNLVVITENDRIFIPKEISKNKIRIEVAIDNPDNYHKSVFVMMKYHDQAESDLLYCKIEGALKEQGYNCVRADDEFVRETFPDDDMDSGRPSVRYWLAMYLCARGIAVFEKDDKDDRIVLNPNIAYEMGIMKQQGKHVDIFVPNVTPNHDEKLFFDVDKDSWKNKYGSESDLIEKIRQCFPKICEKNEEF